MFWKSGLAISEATLNKLFDFVVSSQRAGVELPGVTHSWCCWATLSQFLDGYFPLYSSYN